MATIALAGVIAGANAYVGAAIAIAASMIDGMIFSALTATTTRIDGNNRLDDLKLQTSTYGAAIPRVYGRSRVTGNIIWGTDYTEHVTTTTQKSGKGGGGSKVETTTYTYSTNFAIALCAGGIYKVGRIWADGNLWADFSSFDFDDNGLMVINGITKGDDQRTTYITSGGNSVGATLIRITHSISGFLLGSKKTVKTADKISFEGDENVYTVKNVIQEEYATGNGETSYRTLLEISPGLKKSLSSLKKIYLVASAGVNAVKGDFSWIRVYQGKDTQPRDDFMNSKTDGAPAYRGMAYIVFNQLFVDKFGRRIPSFSFEVIKKDGTNITEIINQISYEAGLDVAQVEAGDLGSYKVTGMTLGNTTTKSVIDELKNAFMFDICEREGAIHFTRRKQENLGPCIWLIDDINELGAYESEKNSDPYKVTRKQDSELPRKVTLSYYSSDKDYQSGTVYSERVNTASNNDESISIQAVIADSQAKEIVEDILWYKWSQRNSYDFTLTTKYAAMLPGDVIRLRITDDRIVYLTVVKTAYGKPGLTKISAESRNTLPPLITNRQIDKDAEKILKFPLEKFDYTTFELFTPSDQKVRIALASTFNWENYSSDQAYAPKLNVFKSKDNGLTWEFVGLKMSDSAYGITKDKLAAPIIPEIWDESNSITVVLKGGELSSRPVSDLLKGYFNFAMVGNEIVQFKNAELIADKTYIISGLLRGRYGTEDQMSTHAVGERFVLLNEDTLVEVNSNKAELYIPLLYRVGPSNLQVDDSSYIQFEQTLYGTPYKPYAVSHVKGVRSDTGDLNITWIRRSRTDSSWKPYVDNGLGEDTEAYEVDILSGNTVKRTIKIDTQTAIYTLAEQVEDFGNRQSSIKLRIYQMSGLVGRGKVKEVTL